VCVVNVEQALKAGNVLLAVEKYTAAINAVPSATLYSNRAEAYLRLRRTEGPSPSRTIICMPKEM
jgi:hypothetical protein